MSVKMTRYKQAEFEDDSSSIGSIQLAEGVTASNTHVRYHTVTSIWKARTLLEKYLLILLLMLLFLLVILGALLSVHTKHDGALQVLHVGPNAPYCLSPSCITAAASIISSIDPSIKPCDDFYQYACGGWIKNNPIPDGKSLWGTFGKLEQQNQLILKNVLEQPITNFMSKAERNASFYYMSCMDVNDTIEDLGAKPLFGLLGKFGGWNISNKFDVKKWNFQKTLQMLQNEYNMGGLFSWAVGEDDRNSSKHIIQIDQGGLTLPTRENYLNKTENAKILSAYLEYMTKIGMLLGGEENSTRKQMKDVLDFETAIAEITIPAEDRRDEEKLYHSMKISKLQEIAPFINWKNFFADALKYRNRQVSNNETVVVYAPEYLQHLTDLIKNYTSNDEGKIILNNYLVWQTVRSLTAYLSKPFREAYKGLRKVLIGSDGGEEPWRYCVTDTNNVIGFAIGAMFVREVFHGDSKPMAEEMINEVKAAFKQNLKGLKWMDKETLKAAEKKADAITDMIGFPNYILTPTELDEKYKDLFFTTNQYFENNIRVNIYNLRRNLDKLDEPVNKTRWGMTPSTVNAYYTPTKNQIVFPAGILQAPFYDIKHPKSLNFGAMGVVMGHELTHAFDDQGREYDQYGNLHKWWNNDTIAEFKEQTDCIVQQYSNYEVNNRHINGKQTLGENIADNGGLKAAYRAYLDWASANEEESPLPGLNLTNKQLFFLSFAQVWCSSSTDEATNLQLEKDPHSPSKFRVIGPVSNLKGFSEVFNCPLGSRMNPKQKCEVW